MPIKFTGPKSDYMAADSDGGYSRKVCLPVPGTTARDIMRGRVNLKGAGRQALISYIKTLMERVKELEAVK